MLACAAFVLSLFVILAGRSLRGDPQSDQPQRAKEELSEPVFELSDDIEAPKPISMPKPSYSESTLKEVIKGTVELSCVVTSKGVPVQISLIQRLHPDLDRAAMEALRQWTFRPGTKQQKPVAVRIRVQFNFAVR